MPFQPFGYRFEIKSPMQPSNVKKAIRGQKKGWFETKSGPRGWIIGPFLCLWNSAFDRHGPMVVARIQADGLGTRVSGRAGSDLNGLIALTFLAPAMAFLLMLLGLEGALSPQFFFLVALFGIGIPLTFWMASSDKREAEPLVRFVRRAVQPGRVQASAEETGTQTPSNVILLINGDAQDSPASEDSVKAAIEGLSIHESVVLERQSERYMQVLSRETDFLLEKREGSADQHFQIALEKGELGDAATYDRSERELIAIMTDYLHGRSEAPSLNWDRITV